VKSFAPFLAAAAVAFLSPSTSVLAETAALTILHTNDTHGHLLPFSYPTLSAGAEAPDVRSDIGGIARRATLAREIREDLRKRGTEVWLVDAGDICDGTPFSTEYRGEADVAAMSAAGYDYAVLGNHEFNNTLARLKKLIQAAEYTVLCANATERSTGRPLAEPYVIEKVGPVRVALIGLVTREAAGYPAAKEGIEVIDEIEAARKLVEDARRRADIVVVLSHIGREQDERLASEVPGVDVIVGAHSHSRLPSGEVVWRSEDLIADDQNGTVIVQAHQWGGELGRLDLLFSKGQGGTWRVDRYRARLIPVTADIRPDSVVEAVVRKYWDPIAARYGEVIGRASADFCGRGDDRAEYNLVADAVRETFGTQFELENLGGVRSPLIKGEITLADLVTLEPFGNTVVTFQIAGRDLKRLLLRHAPAVSGIRYRIEYGELVEATVAGEPIAEDAIYTGATNSYFAGFALKEVPVADTGRSRLQVLTDYIRSKQVVRPAYDGRRVVIG